MPEWRETSEPGASGEMLPKEMPSGLVALSPGIWTASVAHPEPLFPLWLVLWAFVEGVTPDLQPSLGLAVEFSQWTRWQEVRQA